MLDVFRQRGLSNVIYGGVIVATIFAFVVTFRPQAQNKTASLSESCAARIRGRCIDPKDLSAAWRMLMPTGSRATSRKMNLKKVALDGLIERELLGDEAKRLGIGITDRELTDQLYAGYVRVSVPAADPKLAVQILAEMYQGYQRSGEVSPEVAQQHFNDRDTAIPEDFRDQKTKVFDMKVYERKVRNLSNRSTAEFREEQGRELLAAKVRDAIREPIRISESEAWEEYERQKSTAMVTYIPVKQSWVMRWAIDVTQADIDSFLKDNAKALDKPNEDRQKDDVPVAGHIRHILVKLPYGATDEEKAAALAKLSWAAARIKAGEPFAEVARQMSDDTGSAKKGGDVGDKTDGFVLPFKAAADALKPGEITPGAVETQFGYHYIEKDDPSKAAEIADKVKRSVSREIVAKTKAPELAALVAKKLEESIRGGKPVEDAMKEIIAPYVHPQKVETLKVLPTPPGAVDADGGALPATKQPVATATFDASTDGDRPQTQTSSAFNQTGDAFPFALTPDTEAGLMSFAFTHKDGDVLDAPVPAPDGFYVVLLKQHKLATHDEFVKDHESFEQDLLRAKRDEALSLYVKRLRENAKDDIKVDESYTTEAKVDGGDSDDEDEY
ncbi:MAG TPA: peptidylprolyl isomerase [Polyangiaceae bacterium]|jgi:peptidyl-prolyl cis-trans isomerase D